MVPYCIYFADHSPLLHTLMVGVGKDTKQVSLLFSNKSLLASEPEGWELVPTRLNLVLIAYRLLRARRLGFYPHLFFCSIICVLMIFFDVYVYCALYYIPQ